MNAWDPNHRDLVDAFVRGMTPQPRLWFDEWADLYGVVRDARGRQVKWSTDKAPFLRAIMRCLDPKDPTREVILLKPSQIFATAMLLLYYNFRIDTSPVTIVHAMPDIGMVEGFSRTRLAHSLADCERIRGKIAEPKSRDSGNTLDSKLFGDGCSLELRGCNSPSGLSSTPAGFIAVDEADRVAASAKREGDPYGLLKARMKAQEEGKAFMLSSPGDVETSRIEPAYNAGDRRLYYVPCPLCDALIDLQFRRMLWPEVEGHQPLYRCQSCDELFDDSGKAAMMSDKRANWIAMFPERRVASFRLNGLYAPIETWEAIDAERREALAARTTTKLIVHINTTRAEAYDARKAAKVDSSKLDKLVLDVARDDRGAPIIPDGVRVLGVGTDTQGNRLEAVLHGWGKGEEWWHLDRRVFKGDPSVLGKGSVWDELQNYLGEVFMGANGRPMRVTFAAIDYRGNHSASVAEFVRHPRMVARRIWAVAGSSTPGRKLWPKDPSKASHGNELYTVGVNAAKVQIYARLRASVEAAEAIEAAQAKRLTVPPLGGPGIVHIARHIVEEFPEYLAGLTAEVPTPKNGEIHFVHPADAPRNEPLDCAVYAFCAFRGWKRTVSFGRIESTPTPSVPVKRAHLVQSDKSPRLDQMQISGPASPTPAAKAPVRKVPRYL